MPIVKVWCLPDGLTEDDLRAIHKSIVAEAVGQDVGIKDETMMTVLFPPDMMKYGLGSEIIIEVLTGLFVRRGLGADAREKFAKAMVRAVKKLYPKPMVECFIYPFQQEDGFYNCPEGERVPEERRVNPSLIDRHMTP